MLGVWSDNASGKSVHVDAVALPGEPQFEAVMHEALAMHALADAGLRHQVGSALFQHAGTDGGLDRLA